MSCKHDCPKPQRFPAEIHNRPGLQRIGYRIGDYARFKETMLASLNQAWELDSWTHREADDPGIALLEGAAEVAEVLAFYQELYANEAFLRTASWDESLRDLVAITGYRLAPGVGGQAVFAVEVDGTKTVTVPTGFGFKAQLAGTKDKADFESTEEVSAHPAMNCFRLYRPRKPAANVVKGLTCLELMAVGEKRDLSSREALALDSGDRLMLVPDTGLWNKGGGSYAKARTQAAVEILIVKEIEQILDRTVVHLEGALTMNRGTLVTAYKIGRSFRHFGHHAPNNVGCIENNGVYKSTETNFLRQIYKDHPGTDTGPYSRIGKESMPLDSEVDDLAIGTSMICQGCMNVNGRPGDMFTVLREIRGVVADTLTWGGVSGACSLVQLESKLITNEFIDSEEPKADIRHLNFHETLSPALTMQAPSAWNQGVFSAATLGFFGTFAEAKALAGRDLLLRHDDGRVQQVGVASKATDFDVSIRDIGNSWLWPVKLTVKPDIPQEAFDESKSKVTVYGNLVPADQGRTLDEAVLGSGDRRRSFQTFKLPKGPLTHFLDSSQTPPQRPELKIYVGGVLWRQVDSFFGQLPKASVYVMRLDEKGDNYIQFGDGKSGARLPSGHGNVVARFRIGIGASGVLEQDATPSAIGKFKPLKKVYLPGKVVGGGAAELAGQAKENAPGRMQSLGRLVGLADYESEAAAIPGVLKAHARFTAPAGCPQVQVVILTQGGTDADATQVQDILRAYSRCRGAARYPIIVKGGRRRYVRLALSLGYDFNRRQQDIEATVRAALGVMGVDGKDNSNGLFALKQRRFGQDLHFSQVIAAVQQVDGISWVRINDLQAIADATPLISDPANLVLPTTQTSLAAVPCAGDRVLTLYTNHMSLALAGEQDVEECEA